MSIEQSVVNIIRSILPDRLFKYIPRIYYNLNKTRYKFFQRPLLQKETFKAKKRRDKEGFFELYCKGKGVDIGYGGDLLSPNCFGWDIEDGDAHYLEKISNEEFNFLYSSHLLEHLDDVNVTIKNWWLPERDLYEKKKTLPSRFSLDHKHFFKLENDEKPNTIGIMQLLERNLKNYKVIYSKICKEGFTITDPYKHSDGEYSIEIIVQKL